MAFTQGYTVYPAPRLKGGGNPRYVQSRKIVSSALEFGMKLWMITAHEDTTSACKKLRCLAPKICCRFVFQIPKQAIHFSFQYTPAKRHWPQLCLLGESGTKKAMPWFIVCYQSHFSWGHWARSVHCFVTHRPGIAKWLIDKTTEQVAKELQSDWY